MTRISPGRILWVVFLSVNVPVVFVSDVVLSFVSDIVLSFSVPGKSRQ